MKLAIGGLIISAILIALFAAFSSWDAREGYTETLNAKREARQLASVCRSSMTQWNAHFENDVPTVQNGCACIGVKLQRDGDLERENLTNTSRLFEAFVETNHNAMKISHDGRAKPRLQPVGISTQASRRISTAVKQAFEHCDTYTLAGNRRLSER